MRRFSLPQSALKLFSTKTQYVLQPKFKPIEIPKIGLTEFIWARNDKNLDKTAVVCFETGRAYTYHQLYKRVLSFSNFLKKNLKLNKQDTIGLALGNVPEYPIALLGAIQAGLKVTTCNPDYTAEELKRQFDNCNARVVVTSDNILPRVQQATDNIPIIEISTNKSNSCINFEEICSGEGEIPNYNVNINDTIIIPFSSGTTGLPKGVELTHYNLVSNLCQMVTPEFQYIHHNDVIPAFLPLFHLYGMGTVMLQALAQGAKLVTMSKFSTVSFIELLKKHKPDVIFGVPQTVLLSINNPNIEKEDLKRIRSIMSGASPLAASDVDRFLSKTDHKVNLFQAYGMTETSPVVTLHTKMFNYGSKIGGSGILVSNTNVRFVSIGDENLSNLGPNQIGEILVKGPQVMKGYYNNPEATKNTITEDGWLKTGDIGYYDEDEHFFITDRLKELIKVKGFQVAPAELEGVIREHPSVEDAAVIGVPHDVLGEAPKAFIVVKKGSSVKRENLEEFVAGKLAKYKHLHGGIVFLDIIPKTPSGKILRKDLRKL